MASRALLNGWPLVAGLIPVPPSSGGGGTGLQPLSFATSSTIEGRAVNDLISAISGKTAGSRISVTSPTDGSLYTDTTNGVRAGYAGLTVGSPSVTLRETLEAATRDTTLALPVTAVSPLAISAASQAPIAVYSLRRVIPGYAGACLQVRDSGNTLRTLPFKTDGSDGYDATGFSGYGDGVTFTVATLYDQQGGRNLTSTVRPVLKFPNAPTSYDGAFIDFQSKTQNLVTATGSEFLNIGGTANLTVLAVMGTYGWSSAGTHPRSPAVYSNANGPALGYGTASTGTLLFGAFGAQGETIFYSREGTLLADASTPDNTRDRNLAFNQKGAVVSGFGDRRKLFVDRPHGIAASGPNRLVVGNRGDLNQAHNGPVREIVIFQSATPMTDDEVQRLAAGQRAAWNVTGNVRFPDRHMLVGSGQSNINNQGVDAASGDNSTGSNVANRVLAPAIRTGINLASAPVKSFDYRILTTSFGNSAIVKTAQDSTGTNYWMEDATTPGPRLNAWLTEVAAIPGARYRRFVGYHGQGEREAFFMANGGSDVRADWKAQTKTMFGLMRAAVGWDFPIIIQALGKQTGCQPQMDALRAIQTEIATELPNVIVGPETNDLELQDSVHFNRLPSVLGYDLNANRYAPVIAEVMNRMVVPA